MGNRIISNENQCFIIAEIGINHDGSLKQAKELIKSAAESKADAVKIQVRDLNATYNKTILKDTLKAEHGTQYLLNELIKTELSRKDLTELKDLAENLGLIFIATPFDLPSVDFLEELDICAYKIGSQT